VRVGDVFVNGQLYENYASGGLNRDKWLNPEAFKRIVKDGHLNLRVAVNSEDRSSQNNQLGFRNLVDPITKLSADMRVNGVDYTGDMFARARLSGNWYNTGLPGSGLIGDMFVDISLYVDGDTLKGRAVAFHCLDQFCNDGELIFEDDNMGPFNFGQFYSSSIEWTGENFVYQIGSATRSFTPVGNKLPVSAAKFPNHAIGLRILGTTGSADIDASFDNVTLNAPSLGYKVFVNDEQLVFVPSLRRSGEVDLFTSIGEQVTLTHFDLNNSIIDFSVLLSNLYQQNQLSQVRFDAIPLGNDLSLQINRTLPHQRLAEVIILGGASVDPATIRINFSASPFSDWFIPSVKLLVGEDNLFNYLNGFEVAQNGLITHKYQLDEEITISVSGTVVGAEGDYSSLMGQELSGEYKFNIDLRQGDDEFSNFVDSIFDPRYFLRSDQQLASALFNHPEFSSFDGVSIAFDPSFNWINDFDIDDPMLIKETEYWNNLVSYMRFPNGIEMMPGPYNLLEFNAFRASTEGANPEIGGSISVNDSVEMLLFAATDTATPFENWLDWFPRNAEFVLLVGIKFDQINDGDVVEIGKFFVKVDKVSLISNSLITELSFINEANKSRRRGGFPIWLPAVVNE